MNNKLKYIFFSGLVLLPFVYWPWHPIPYEVPRVLIYIRWIELLVLAAIIIKKLSFIQKPIDTACISLLISYLFVVLLSAVFGEDLTKSLWGNHYRGDGIVTLLHHITLFFFCIYFWENSWKEGFVKAFMFSNTLLAVWVMGDALRLYLLHDVNLLNWDGALAVSFGNPNSLAGYLLVTLPFTLFQYKKNAFWFCVFILQILAILFTKSWAGVLGVILACMIWGVFRLKRDPLANWLLFGGVMLFIMTLIMYSVITYDSSYVAEGRSRIFYKLYLSVLERPVLGWGWANVDYAFDSIEWPIKAEQDVYIDKAHSTLLETLVTTGFLGLTLYICFICYTFVTAYKRVKKNVDPKWSACLICVFVLFILHSQTNVISVHEEMIFWLVSGIILSKKAAHT